MSEIRMSKFYKVVSEVLFYMGIILVYIQQVSWFVKFILKKLTPSEVYEGQNLKMLPLKK